MEINGEKLVAAPREQVWQALNDTEVLKACIQGCQELDKISDTEMKSVVQAKFGPVKAKFKADITLEDIDPARSCKLVGKGTGGAAGFANGVAHITLTDKGEDTLVGYQVDFSVGGKIAQIGARLLGGTTNKIVNHFFETLSAQLERAN